MKRSYLLRSLFMTLALLGTIYSMSLLRTNDGVGFFESMGFGKHTANTLAWCQTRAASIRVVQTQDLIIEKNRKWLVESKESVREIPYLEMEKWLGEYCQLKVDREISTNDAIQLAVTPVLEIELIDKTKHSVYRLGSDGYQYDRRSFYSTELNQAIERLSGLVTTAR